MNLSLILLICRYTWQKYAASLVDMARIYSFWKFTSKLERAETRRYLCVVYSLCLQERSCALVKDTSVVLM